MVNWDGCGPCQQCNTVFNMNSLTLSAPSAARPCPGKKLCKVVRICPTTLSPDALTENDVTKPAPEPAPPLPSSPHSLESGEVYYDCPQCQSTARDQAFTPGDELKCPQCGFEFLSEQGLNRRRTFERPPTPVLAYYDCPNCGASIPDEDYTPREMLVCHECDCRFRSEQGLNHRSTPRAEEKHDFFA
jgi:predicted RNA-binding Zn-ribbon protein involved in translation (DUF1610 family)